MGLFDVFKSKEQKELDKTMEDMLAILFPNGEIDIVRDSKRVHLLLQGKLSMDECRACVKGSKAIIYVSEDKSAERIVPSIMARTNNKSTEKEAYSIYAYLSGEAMYLDRINAMGLGGNVTTSDLHQNGVDADKLPNGYGEYGLTVTNPILTISSYGSENYLSRLRFNGQPITYKRLGSTSSDVTTGSIDIYPISCLGKPLGNIYICPYHRRNSKKAPKGFTFINK
jgi:hypothetical protein